MVLPEGIELSTSPLPRECSTTELRQHASARDGPGATKAHVLRPRERRSRRTLPQAIRPGKSQFDTPIEGPQRLCANPSAARPNVLEAASKSENDAEIELTLMTDPGNRPPPATAKSIQKPGRSERLADELRANLRRRKDQARSRADASDRMLPAPEARHGKRPPEQSGE